MTTDGLPILSEMVTNKGMSLKDMSSQTPVLLIFLRHFGCVFCREALHDISNLQDELKSQAVKAVFVHMGPEDMSKKFFDKYDIKNPVHVMDQEQKYYTAFGLMRATTSQLASFRTFLRGFQSSVIDGHGAGRVIGDGFQMPGVFVIYQGEVVNKYIHQNVADRPDYMQLLKTGLQGIRESN